IERIRQFGINSPFEEFAIAEELNRLGIHAVYVRAIYATGSPKVERSMDSRRYESHRSILDIDANPILGEDHNYISIRGYYNGPDEWVSKNENALLTPIDLARAARKQVIDEPRSRELLERVVSRLREAGYDGSLLKPNDILLAMDAGGAIMKDRAGEPDVIICNFEVIWKINGAGPAS
ncbi:MAG TPA: hypothetical protein VIX18_08350, partial [Nitrospirota bacterium]